MQRLHQQDLVGEVKDRGDWTTLSLPAISVEDESYAYDTPYGSRTYCRKVGAALHPERDSAETYRKIRAAIGEYNFQSQYQQDPGSLEGGLIKPEWIRYYAAEQKPKEFDYILQSWDTASKAGEMNDYSVCTTWGVLNGSFYLLDVFRRRLTFPQLKKAVAENFKKFDVSKVLVEDRSSGIALIQELQMEIYCLEAYRPEAGQDKVMRLAAQSIKFESGRVYLPNDASWLKEFKSEIIGFPGTKHDDQIDSTSQALEYLGRMVPYGENRLGGAFSWGRETC
jgi:predicted phage terminase large subunit-like protein